MAISPDIQRAGAEATTSEARAGTLADVLDVMLDKGLVIDAFVRVSLVGIEILTIDARVVVASVETYMHYAREAQRLQLGGGQGSAKQGLAGMMGRLEEGGAHSITRGALRGAGEGLREGLLPHRPEKGRAGGVVQRAVGSIRDAITSDHEEKPAEREPAEEERSAGEGSARSAPRSARQRPSQQSRRAGPASRQAPSRAPRA